VIKFNWSCFCGFLIYTIVISIKRCGVGVEPNVLYCLLKPHCPQQDLNIKKGWLEKHKSVLLRQICTPVIPGSDIDCVLSFSFSVLQFEVCQRSGLGFFRLIAFEYYCITHIERNIYRVSIFKTILILLNIVSNVGGFVLWVTYYMYMYIL
jgi:hypothetical protein